MSLWRTTIATLLVTAGLTGCSPSGTDLPHACAAFDRGYAAWRASHSAARDSAFLVKLDQAISDAGTSSLGSNLQAAAAAARELAAATTPHQTQRARKILAVAVTGIRRTCPAV